MFDVFNPRCEQMLATEDTPVVTSLTPWYTSAPCGIYSSYDVREIALIIGLIKIEERVFDVFIHL